MDNLSILRCSSSWGGVATLLRSLWQPLEKPLIQGMAAFWGVAFVASQAMASHPATVSTSSQPISEVTTARSEVVSQKMSDGIYLYGQSPNPNQLGSAYIVFQVNNNRVVGAFYMPYSSFDCFHGEVQATQLALNVIDSYERTVHPLSVALDVAPPVASMVGVGSTPVSLEGFHRLNTVTENDQRILSTCQAEPRPGSS